jgi:hypothetical protein
LLRFELLDQRRVLASITGQVYNDADFSLRKDDAEVGLENRVVYLDLNDNGEIDSQEPLRLTDAEGRFAFDNLARGDYVVRLFNGTESQKQDFPFAPQIYRDTIPVTDPYANGTGMLAGLATDGLMHGYTAAGRVLTEIALDTSSSQSIELDGEIVGLQPLGSGQVLAWLDHASPSDGSLAVIVSFETGEIISLDADLPAGAASIGDFALARDGRGIFVPATSGQDAVPLYRFGFSPDVQGWTTTSLELNVSPSSQILGGESGPLILVAQPTAVGTQVALVSTVTSRVVSGSEATLGDSFEFLAFDDSASLAVGRDAAGVIHVMDSANSFQTLRTLNGWDGEVVLDGRRELLFGLMSSGDLEIYDIVGDKTLAVLALGTDIGAAAAMALSDRGNGVAIRGRNGVSQVRIDNVDAHRVSLSGLAGDPDADSNDLFFGLYLDGENLAPEFNQSPEYQVLEDRTLVSPAPGVVAGLANPENDQHVAIQVSEPAHGVAVVEPNGALRYVPNLNFFGTDSFDIRVSDGRDITDSVTVLINVLPVDDGPQGILVNIPPVSETLRGPAVIGTIFVDEVDGDPYIITLNDIRLTMDGNDVILVDGQILDHEEDPNPTIIITVTNPNNEDDSGIFTATITVEDADDPPTDVLPNEAEVEENQPGAVIALLSLVDDDASESYILSVTDPRFVIVGRTLKLADMISLDHETEPLVPLTITVSTADGQLLLSSIVEVTVTDANDSITAITLTGQTVPEFASGYTVGGVLVSDADANSQHLLSVDDTRFEITNSSLKLRDGVYVRRADQEEILLTITASTLNDGSDSFSQAFVITVTSNESPWHNPVEPTDVNADGDTDPTDALIIINNLNNAGPRILEESIPYEDGLPRFYDVNGDGRITPIDALIIINILNRGGVATAEPGDGGITSGSGEGETGGNATDPGLAGPIVNSPYLGNDDDDDDDDR